MNLPEQLLRGLERLKFVTPTPIQADIIPLAMSGRDILGSAQTGTGKTLAFALPIISKLLQNPESRALILTPTRELAQQVALAISQLLERRSPLSPILLIGGEAMHLQLARLERTARMIVGTPGRVIDHLERQTIDLSNCNILVLDEADRMLDMGFSIQLDKIVADLPKVRQTLMFSATVPPKIEGLAKTYLSHPERIAIGSVITPSQNITQEIINLDDESEKYDHLVTQLNQREGSVIIFVKTKIGAKKLALKLEKMDFAASAIHGDLRQNKRERVLKAFRQGRYRIMVATDIAARGLDVPHIQHVVNYDLPQCPEDYIHRIGRTARAGATGNAVCFITPQSKRLWREIQAFMEPEKYKSAGTDGGSRPYSSRSRGFSSRSNDFGSRPPRRYDDKPRRDNTSFSKDKDGDESAAPKEYKPRRDDDRPRREFKPFNRDGESSTGRPLSSRPRRDDDRPRREFKPFNKDGETSSDRPYSSRPPRRDNDSFGKKDGESSTSRPFSSRPRRDDDRPRRDFNPFNKDGESSSSRPYSSRPPRRDNNSFGRTDGDRPFSSRPPRRDNDSFGKPSDDSSASRGFSSRPRRDDDRPRRDNASFSKDGRYPSNRSTSFKKRSDS